MSCKASIAAFLACVITLSAGAVGGYTPSPRDTGPRPPALPGATGVGEALGPEWVLLHETPVLTVHFREDRGILAIRDRRNGYLWKTGLDLPFNTAIQELVDEGTDPRTLPPLEDRLNTTFVGIANSLVSLEVWDNANNIRRVGGAAERGVRRSLTVLGGSPWKAVLRHQFTEVRINLDLEIEVSDDTLRFRIPAASLQGDGLARLGAVNIAPFLGASGGRQRFWDPARRDWGEGVAKAAPPGYAVIPDGTGALVRFRDNSTRLAEYRQPVYGPDLGQAEMYRSATDFSPSPKQAFVPLFGMVHGAHQNAFAAWARSGAEHLEIVAWPEENLTLYTHAYPRFVYNRLYYQVYNQRGDGYYKLLDQPNRFDIDMSYRFLEGANGPSVGTPPAEVASAASPSSGLLSADWAGIAQAYRAFLQEQGALPSRPAVTRQNIPLRVDFLMADVRRSIVGHAHQVVATLEDVERITADLESRGMDNLSLGLLGYSRGGTVLSRPGALEVLPALGSRRDFTRTIEALRDRGHQVSLGRDFGVLGDGQALAWGNAIKGASGWYLEHFRFQANAPVNRFWFPRTDKALDWLSQEARAIANLGAGALMVDGLAHRLYSDYPSGGAVSRSETMDLLAKGFGALDPRLEMDLVRPNPYLWSRTRRFLDMPVFSTQYLIETDTVPLLPMILQGSMDLFAPWSNFSFSSPQDVLRMIDYHVYPSFIITGESSHQLLMTNSAALYSTQYENFRDLIPRVWQPVNEALAPVMGARWLHREVLAPGVVANHYDNGLWIVVNYTPSPYTLGSNTVPGESARVLGSKGAPQ